MAGEWLKFESNTPDKPEVFAITTAMGWDDPDLTVGKLLRVWRWFDQHTTDGNAPSVTPALLDRVSGVTGFALAMQKAGWLIVTEAGVSLPNFDRNNGETAKKRALGAKRSANQRVKGVDSKRNLDERDKSDAPSVTPALPRVEKKREEKKEEGEKPRATRIPPDFEPKPEPEAEAGIDRPKELANFRDYWTAKAGKDAAKLDWQAAWRQWVRKADRPGVSRFAKPAPNATVPGKTERDPELTRLDIERARAVPMPAAIREQMAKLKQGATA